MTVLYIRARFNICVVVLPAKEDVLQNAPIGAANLIETVFNEYQKFEGEGSERINTSLSIIY